MKTRRFERVMLGLVGFAVIATASAAVVSPATGVTAAPRVSFDIAAAEPAALTVERAEPRDDDPQIATLDLTGIDDTEDLAQTFERMGYHLDHVRDLNAPVPRVYLAKLPSDLHSVPEVALKKTIFFKAMLPLILQENERILADRHRLYELKAARALGQQLPARDRLWLSVLAQRYKLKDDSIDALLKRVDVVPTSLAMAQAAEESGWGTSRFVKVANALFGQWTTGDEGVVPKAREEGMDHKIRAFDTLSQSVSAYMRNLNTHRAYRKFRDLRTRKRTTGKPINGYELAGTLTKYSERGQEYVESIRVIIDANELRDLDDARLADPVGKTDRAA